jgi:hypothetical protein
MVQLVAALGLPALMIAMGGAELGGPLCMTLTLALTSDVPLLACSHSFQ